MTFFEIYTQWFAEQPEPIRQTVARVFRNREVYISNYDKRVIPFSKPSINRPFKQ